MLGSPVTGADYRVMELRGGGFTPLGSKGTGEGFLEAESWERETYMILTAGWGCGESTDRARVKEPSRECRGPGIF